MSRFSSLSRIAIAALASCAAIALAALPTVPGEPSVTPKDAARAPMLRLGAAAAPRVTLPEVSAAEMAGLRETNARTQFKRVAIGIARPITMEARLGSADLSWASVEGGSAARLAVTSPQAGALRLAVELAGVPGEVEMVVFGSDSARLEGPVRVADIPDRSSPWWTPITDGESQTIEFFAPAGIEPTRLGMRVNAASHLFTTAASGLSKRVSEIGTSGSCNVDVKCSALASSQAFVNARNAVAQMVFVDGSTTYLCTGTLVNDTDPGTQIPWFLTANHCFDNETLPLKTAAQMQQVAATLNTLWFFDSVACGSRTVPDYVQLTNGAQYITSNPGWDVLLVKLNSTAPPGAFFAGWDPNAPTAGTAVIAITHPQGDLKKVSQGTISTFGMPPVAAGATTQYSEVLWSSGTTEPGSSGGAFWTNDGLQYLVRGTLWGGSAQCANPNGLDYFSRFDIAYPQLAAYLAPAPTSSTDYTDMWWNPAESGWGLNVVQHASRAIFAIWYTYGADGKRTWYHMPGGSWTSANTYTGTLYASSGGAAGGAFDPSAVVRTAVGTGTLTFTDGYHGAWAFSVNGSSGTKSITRLVY